MARKRRKTKLRRKRKVKTSGIVINPLESISLKSDDLAILSVYVEIISNIIGLWSLYLSRLEDELEESENQDEIAPLSAGAVRRVTEQKRNKKKKRK